MAIDWARVRQFASSVGQCVDRCRRYCGYGGVDVSETSRLRMGRYAADTTAARSSCWLRCICPLQNLSGGIWLAAIIRDGLRSFAGKRFDAVLRHESAELPRIPMLVQRT